MDGIGDVGADGIVQQLIQADDAHQTKAERKANGQQEKNTADAQSKDDSRNQ
jgi:hypothetical protein